MRANIKHSSEEQEMLIKNYLCGMEFQHSGECKTPRTVFGMWEMICKLQICRAWLQISEQ